MLGAGLQMVAPLFMRFIIDRVLLDDTLTRAARVGRLNLAGAAFLAVIPDTESEQLIQAAMATLLAGRTTFVIAHRLSTIRRADLILLMDDGQVVERGTHEQLMQARGSYRAMVLRRMEAADDDRATLWRDDVPAGDAPAPPGAVSICRTAPDENRVLHSYVARGDYQVAHLLPGQARPGDVLPGGQRVPADQGDRAVRPAPGGTGQRVRPR